jgi:hypothetical protein
MKSMQKPLAGQRGRKELASGGAVVLRLRRSIGIWAGRHPAMRQSARMAA